MEGVPVSTCGRICLCRPFHQGDLDIERSTDSIRVLRIAPADASHTGDAGNLFAQGPMAEQQARHILWACEEQGVEARFFLHDNGRCYADEFDTMLRGSGVDPIHTSYGGANVNAFVERWIRSVRQECLDHLVLLGLSRLPRVIDEYRRFYNGRRPHQGIGNWVPDWSPLPDGLLLPASKSGLRSGDIRCEHFLGGLLKSYFRREAQRCRWLAVDLK